MLIKEIKRRLEHLERHTMIMYRFNPIHIKITSNFLVDINELIPNIFEKNKVGEFTLTDVKAYHKAEV